MPRLVSSPGGESDGEECYYFVRVQRYGLGSTANGCADTGGIEEALKSRMWPGDTQTGDDGFVDDELTVRTVHWDGLAEVLVLTEIAIRPCTEVTTGISTGESPDVPLNEYQLQQPWVLIQGALGDVAAGDDSCC